MTTYRLDKTSLLVTVDAESKLSEFRKLLRRDALAFGYHPLEDSDESIGSYLERRTPNLYHFKHGSLADLVSSLEVTLPSGSRFHLKDAPRAAIGPDFNRIMIGSRGKWGRIVEATFKLHAIPESALCMTFSIPHPEDAKKIIAWSIGQFIKPLFFRHLASEDAAKSSPAKSRKKNRESDSLFLCIAGSENRVAAEEEMLKSYAEDHDFEIHSQELTLSQSIVDHHVFNSVSYEKILQQYIAFLWPSSDPSAQTGIEKKLFAK